MILCKVSWHSPYDDRDHVCVLQTDHVISKSQGPIHQCSCSARSDEDRSGPRSLVVPA